MSHQTATARRVRTGPTVTRAALITVAAIFIVVWWGAWISFYVIRPVVMFLDGTRHDLFGAVTAIGALPW